MLILAAALGLWFGWILEKLSGVTDRAFTHLVKYFKINAKAVPKIKSGLQIAWISFSSLLFVLVVFIFISSQYEGYSSYFPTPRAQALSFITAPKQLTFLVSFLSGWMFYRYRGRIGAFLLATTTPPEKNATKSRGRTKVSAWLTGGVAMTAIAAVAVIVLLMLAPDGFSRLSQFKIGNVEARFAAASEHSVRTNQPFFGGTVTARQILQRGVQLPAVLDDVVIPIEERLTRGMDDKQKQALRVRRDRVSVFLKAFATPLAQAVTCYLQEFPVGDTEVQHEAVIVASRWRGITLQEIPPDHFKILAKNSFELISSITGKLHPGTTVVTSGSRPKYSDDEVPAMRPDSTCDMREADRPDGWMETTADNIQEILSDGLAISFISNLIAFTQDFTVAANFLERAEARLDKSREIGAFYFYDSRAKAKYFSRWYPMDSARSDIVTARRAVDQILGEISNGKDLAGKEYFEVERARMINNRIYFLVTEALEGRRLIPKETNELRTLFEELDHWIVTMVPSLGRSAEKGISKLIHNKLADGIAAFYDTLATEQIAMGQLSREFPKERCALIRTYLDKAQDQYTERAREKGEAEYRDSFKIVQAHRNMYETICVE